MATGIIIGLIAVVGIASVSYTHLRAHETVLDLVCRLLLEKKKIKNYIISRHILQTQIDTQIASSLLTLSQLPINITSVVPLL